MKTDVSAETVRIIHEFTQEIAHQIRNPLGSIELFASLLLKDHQGERDRKRIRQIMKAVQIIERRLSEFMMSSKTLSIPLEVIDINGFIKETVGFAEHIGEGDEFFLHVKYSSTDHFIRGSKEMLKHLFINLIFNALKNLPQGCYLRLEIAGDGTAAHLEQIQGGGEFIHVTLAVIETEMRTPRAIRSPLEVFFPLAQRNTCLGLSVLHSIVEFHRGFFSLRDEGHEGMSIQISLPRYSKV